MVEAHAADIGLRGDIEKQAGHIRIVLHQPLGSGALQRQTDDHPANMLSAQLVQPGLQRDKISLRRHRYRHFQLMQAGMALYRGGDLRGACSVSEAVISPMEGAALPASSCAERLGT